MASQNENHLTKLMEKPPVGFAVFNTIGIIEQLSRTMFERKLPDGLKVAHFAVLNHLIRLGDGKSPVELARAFQVTKGAMTKTLSRLTQRECITISANPDDGRSKLVFLTEKGIETRNSAIAAVEPMLSEIYAVISKNEFEDALPFLHRLAALLDELR